MDGFFGLTSISTEKYLKIEPDEIERHEYYQGLVNEMPSKKFPEIIISGNILYHVASVLDRTAFKTFSGNLRVCVEEILFFTYPDLSIFCKPIITYHKRDDTGTNPVVLFEITSPETVDYDRKTKFQRYQQLHSLKEYFLISSTKIFIEQFRLLNNKWNYNIYDKEEDAIMIDSIQKPLLISDIYKGFGDLNN